MIETIITSSILIVIVLTLRFLLRGKLSPTVIYALWAIVALRLLVPVSVFDSKASVMNLITKPKKIEQIELQDNQYTGLLETVNSESVTENNTSNNIQSNPKDVDSNTNNKENIEKGVSVKNIALVLWLTGITAVLGYTLSTNIHFNRLLKSTRRSLRGIHTPLPVYEVRNISSPCLYGVLKPSIYLTDYAADDRQRAGYVITHELMHYRHLDHIWAVVRVLCCAVYWFNPLVWIAAHLSRQDRELACDSAVVNKVGEEYRLAYGRTLVDMVSVGVVPSDLVLTSTTMSSGNHSIKERITMIKNKPKTILWAALITAVIVLAACIITFTGADSAEPPNAIEPTLSGADVSSIDTLASDEYPDLLGEYTTSYNAGNLSRSNNIELAADMINGTVLNPGEEFSFNRIVGQRTPERGFSKATLYSWEENVEDYGGGISQTATTIFNAAFFSGMEITERWNNLFSVSYTTMNDTQCYGNDSAIEWNVRDLRFVNNYEHPVRITMQYSGGYLTAQIHGTSNGVAVEMGFDEIEVKPYETVYHQWKEGKTDQHGAVGRTIDVYRIIHKEGEEDVHEYAYTAVYMPLMQVIYTNELPEGYEYDEVYNNLKMAVDGSSGYHYFPAGVSSETIWNHSELQHLLENTPEFTGGECVDSSYFINGMIYEEVLSTYTAETDILELVFRNIEPGYVQEYVDQLTKCGFTYFSDDMEESDGPSIYIVYNAPQYGVGIQIQGYVPGQDTDGVIISYFKQRDGCYGYSEPVPKG